MKNLILAVTTLLVLACSTKNPKNPDSKNKSTIPGDSIASVTIDPVKTSDINTDSQLWKGTWERLERNYGGTLKIDKIENNVLYFNILALNGGHTGDFDGTAKITGNKALYKFKGNGQNCVLEFTLFKDQKIEVDQKTDECDGGMGVFYRGTYVNAKLGKKAPEENLVSLGILQTPQQESIFKKLVGNRYDAFLNSSQLQSEVEDLDGMNFKGVASGVRGLYTFMENIILYNSKGEFWCAVIDDEKVYYFTNSTQFRNKLPLTIEEWRKDFKDWEVVFN